MGWVCNRMVPKLVRTRPAVLVGMGGSLWLWRVLDSEAGLHQGPNTQIEPRKLACGNVLLWQARTESRAARMSSSDFDWPPAAFVTSSLHRPGPRRGGIRDTFFRTPEGMFCGRTARSVYLACDILATFLQRRVECFPCDVGCQAHSGELPKVAGRLRRPRIGDPITFGPRVVRVEHELMRSRNPRTA